MKGDGEVSKLPKLKVKRTFAHPLEQTCDLEQAKELVFGYGSGILVIVDGQLVRSYEELVKLAAQPCYKDKELLEVIVASAPKG